MNSAQEEKRLAGTPYWVDRYDPWVLTLCKLRRDAATPLRIISPSPRNRRYSPYGSSRQTSGRAALGQIAGVLATSASKEDCWYKNTNYSQGVVQTMQVSSSPVPLGLIGCNFPIFSPPQVSTYKLGSRPSRTSQLRKGHPSHT